MPCKPDGIPSCPHQSYSDDWKGFGDWLGTGRVANHRRTFLPFEEAREFVRSLHLVTLSEWRLYAAGRIRSLGTRPDWIPSDPAFTYKKHGWAGIRDWLGTGDKRPPGLSRMRPFVEARQFARSLNLRSWSEWRAYVQGSRTDLQAKPADVPAIPHSCYRKHGWKNYGDFLGSGSRAWHQVQWRPFTEAREFVRKLKIPTRKAYRLFAGSTRKPKDIPANPEKAYSEWVSWPDFLSSSGSRRLTRRARV